MWIDTHAHLYLPQFDDDRDQVMEDLKGHGVDAVYLPDIDSSTSDALDRVIRDFPFCRPMTGLHPCSVKEDVEKELAHVKDRLECVDGLAALGEIGLDYYWDKSYIDAQQKAFELQVEWARERQLPVVIHSRDSLEDTISTIERLSKGDITGVFHCFNGTLDQAKRIMDVGFLMGLGGVVTFKKANLDDMIRSLTVESFVLETDAPYLSPVPYRGKRNESAYIPIIGEYIAQVREEEVEAIAKQTSENARRCFRS